MAHLISIDPGISSGIAVFRYTATQPAQLVHSDQFRGGVEELTHRITQLKKEYRNATYICEDFQARPQTGFSYTTASLEPLACIGALTALHIINRKDRNQMVTPAMQYFSGGKGKQERKKRQHEWLKESGLYVTGKQFGTPDADDARSAIAHGIAWLRKHHKPTARRYFPPQQETPASV